MAEAGSAGIEDLLLSACLQDQRFDRQAESSRADWMFGMIRHTSAYSRIRRQILERLPVETEEWHLEQLIGLAAAMAASGDTAAWDACRAAVLESARAGRDIEIDTWIALAGADGLLALARCYGARLLAHPGDGHWERLLWSDDVDWRMEVLRGAASDPAIAACLERAQALKPAGKVRNDVAALTEQVRAQHSVESILSAARAGEREFPAVYMAFGKAATADERAQIYDRLTAAEQDHERVRLLWAFRRAPLPTVTEQVLRWAREGTDALRAAAIAALAGMQDPGVHALAVAKLDAGEVTGADSEVLGLLTAHVDAEDAHRIARAFDRISHIGAKVSELQAGRDDWHSLGYGLIQLGERHPHAGFGDAMRIAYANTPCGACRSKIVGWLHDHGQFDAELRQECLHDAEPATRRRAAAA